MMERPVGRRQLDLLVRAANAPEPNPIPPPIPPPIRAEVTFLLTLLMAEHLAAETALPVEASNG